MARKGNSHRIQGWPGISFWVVHGIIWLFCTATLQTASAQAYHVIGPCEEHHPAPDQDYADENYWLCEVPEIRKYYENVGRQKRLMHSPLFQKIWNDSAPKIKQEPDFKMSTCRAYERPPDTQKQKACVIQLLERQQAWVVSVWNTLMEHPDFIKTVHENEDCKNSNDALMPLLCDTFPGVYKNYSRILELESKLNAANATPAMRAYLSRSNAWRNQYLENCRKKDGCRLVDFSPWYREISELIEGEEAKRDREEALNSATYLSCQFPTNGRNFERTLTLFTSGKVEMLEPPSNPVGIPLERTYTVYYGQQQKTGAGVTIVFTSLFVGANDSEAQNLVNGIGGGINLNDGRFAASVIDHKLTFPTSSMTQAQYVFVTKSRNTRLTMTCRVTKRPS